MFAYVLQACTRTALLHLRVDCVLVANNVGRLLILKWAMHYNLTRWIGGPHYAVSRNEAQICLCDERQISLKALEGGIIVVQLKRESENQQCTSTSSVALHVCYTCSDLQLPGSTSSIEFRRINLIESRIEILMPRILVSSSAGDFLLSLVAESCALF